MQVCTSTSPGSWPRPARPTTWTQQLERSLGGAEVGQVERHVGVQHAHQRHAREVEPLRDHLGAEQDVAFAAREVGERSRRTPALTRATSSIEPQHARARESAGQLALGALRAGARVSGSSAAAARSGTRLALVVIAVVDSASSRGSTCSVSAMSQRGHSGT